VDILLEEIIVLTLEMVTATEMAMVVMGMVATATVETVVETVAVAMAVVEMVVDLYKSAYGDKNGYKIAS
jgi:hypothetical protein